MAVININEYTSGDFITIKATPHNCKVVKNVV